MKTKGQEKCTFSLSIPHFKQFVEDGNEATTATTDIGGFQWRFAACIAQLHDGAFLSAIVDCRRTGRTAWATKANFAFTLTNSQGHDVSSHYLAPFYGRAEDENCYYNDFRLAKIEDILREDSGFIRNDELVLSCIIVYTTPCPILDGMMGERHWNHNVTLIVDGREVHTWQELLSAHSTHFAEMFLRRDQLDEEDSEYGEDIEIPAVDFFDFCDFYLAAFTKMASVDASNVRSLVSLSKRFQATSLLVECEHFLRRADTMTTTERLKAADLLPDNDLLDDLIEKLSTTDLKSLLSPTDAEGLKKETVATLYAKIATKEPVAHRKLLVELMTRSEDLLEEAKKKHECPICRQKEIDTVFSCGHTACRDCADELTECHVCKTRVRSDSRVYLPY